jgi:hypothetical protein
MLNIKQLEKLENDYLDLQIKEINEEEKRETQKIKEDFKVKNFILNNLRNKEIEFDFDFYNDEDLNFYYGLFINIKYIKNDDIKYYTLTQYYTYQDFYQITMITNEEINQLIQYKNQKIKEKQNDEQEQEF